MPERSSKFIYTFFILFLCILLSMFLMFTAMVHYDRDVRVEGDSSTAFGEAREASDSKGGGLPDLTALYRANLFAIDLCLIVLAEAALIILFVKFTVPAVLIATVTMLLMAANSAQQLRGELIPSFVSPFVSNNYATLTYTDLILLIVLSGLIVAFLVSVLLKQSGMQIDGEPSQETASSPSSSSPSSPPPPSQ